MRGTAVIFKDASGAQHEALVTKVYDPTDPVDGTEQCNVDLAYLDATGKIQIVKDIVHVSKVPPGPHYRQPDQV